MPATHYADTPRLISPSGLKRLGFGLAAVAAAGFGAVAMLPLLVPAAAVRAAVMSEVQFVTGLTPVLRGDVSVSVFPSGSVSFSDVTLSGDRSYPALTAERLTTHVRFLPLLLGRIEVADVALVRPKILVNVDSAGRSNWSALLETLARTLTPGAAKTGRVMSFSEIRLSGGTLLINDEATGTIETLDAVELSLAWPSISRSFGATGQFVWRGEKVDASVSVGDFLAALNGDRSGFKVRLASQLLKLAFDGHLSHRPTLRVEGTLAADSLSLRSALRWTGQKPLPGGGLGRFALKAQTNVVGSTIALSSVNVELDGNTAEGVLTFTGNTAGRPCPAGHLGSGRAGCLALRFDREAPRRE